jgi:hypothetical protein
MGLSFKGIGSFMHRPGAGKTGSVIMNFIAEIDSFSGENRYRIKHVFGGDVHLWIFH